MRGIFVDSCGHWFLQSSPNWKGCFAFALPVPPSSICQPMNGVATVCNCSLRWWIDFSMSPKIVAICQIARHYTQANPTSPSMLRKTHTAPPNTFVLWSTACLSSPTTSLFCQLIAWFQKIEIDKTYITHLYVRLKRFELSFSGLRQINAFAVICFFGYNVFPQSIMIGRPLLELLPNQMARTVHFQGLEQLWIIFEVTKCEMLTGFNRIPKIRHDDIKSKIYFVV